MAVLRSLRQAGAAVELVLSEWALHLVEQETGCSGEELRALAEAVHDNGNMAASICSSSYLVDGMVVVPASVKTVSDLACAHADTLIARAGDNMLRLRRPLVVCLRETPLSGPTLENLARLSRHGAIIMPLSPGFYHQPERIEDLVDFMAGKVLDALGIDNETFRRWQGNGP